MCETWRLAVFSVMNSALADLSVGPALGQQREHLSLAAGQA
jgi:hypothetical protein